jgi:hypothetical protein
MQAAEKGDKRCIASLRVLKGSGEMVARADRLHFSHL